MSYSSLYMESISSDDDYKHAQNVWKTFNIADMGMYHDLYMDSDVLLLTDVFENFSDTCLNIYKLDPAHFFTAPGQGTLKIEGITTHKFVYTRLLKFLVYSRAIQIDPCCSVQALYR